MRNTEYHHIDWIDTLKGMSILLVVFGHALQETSIPTLTMLNKYIYSFHMPLFFFISGLNFRKIKYQNFLSLVKNKSRALLLPYVTFYILSLPIVLYGISQGVWNVDYSNLIVGFFIAKNIGNYMIANPPLWYLPCLFVAFLIYYFVNHNFSNISLRVFVFIILFFAGVHIPFFLPWSLDTAMVASCFIAIGYHYKKSHLFHSFSIPKTRLNIDSQSMPSTPSFLKLILLLIIIAGIVVALINTNVEMGSNRYGNIIFFFLSSISGITLFVILSKLCENSSYLKYVGKNTLIIFGTHLVLFRIIKGLCELFSFRDSAFSELFTVFFVFSFTMICMIPVIHVFNTYLYVIIGMQKQST